MRKRLCVLLALAGWLAGCGKKPAQVGSTQPGSPGEAVAAAQKPGFSDYPVAPKPEITPEFVARGKFLYDQNCSACHGVNGDGKAPAAAFLLPKPRSFTDAKYRLRSTPAGNLPTDADLFRAISLGMPGTPMPPWHHMFDENDRWAVVEYIKSFSPRFADPSEDRKTTVDLGIPPKREPRAIAEGKELYAKMNCSACHGENGRGDGPSVATLLDDAGVHTKPRDFTRASGFKSGPGAKEIVRTILTGFDGTPMAAFAGAVKPEEAWKIAYYVESLAKPVRQIANPASQNFLVREELGPPDVRIRLTERAWQFDPATIRVKKGQVVEITFEPTDNGLGVGHGFAVSSYDEVAFITGAMVGVPKTVKFRADRAGKFTYYCATQCSTDKLHPLMNGTFIVEDTGPTKTALLDN